MPKKKKAEEHENLERWLVSYADFMTLLFATFVVLYALAQTDMQDFAKLEESIKSAFSNLALEGGQNIMDGIGENIIGQGSSPDNNAVIPPMMEYLSQKYERTSMENIKEEIEESIKKGDLKDVEASITERGLVITLKDLNIFFRSGSAYLTPEATKTLASIGEMIKKKFNSHMIRVEGHTDNLPISGGMFPSNWELSAARSSAVARFLISKFSMKPDLFTVIGYGDTKPIETNATSKGRAKNRRIEIVILRHQAIKYEPMGQETISPQSPKNIDKIHTKNGISDAAQNLLKEENAEKVNNVIILDEYNKADSIKIKKAIKNFEEGKFEHREDVKNKF